MKNLKITDYYQIKEMIKDLNFNSMREYKIWAKENDAPLNSDFFKRRGIDFSADDFLSKKKTFETYDDLVKALNDYNKKSDNPVTTQKKYRIWAKENGAPTDPKSTYNLDNFSIVNLLNKRKISYDEFMKFIKKMNFKNREEYREWIEENKNSYAQLPCSPEAYYRKYEFNGQNVQIFSLISGKLGTIKKDFVSKKEAIEFYKSEIKRQNVIAFNNLDKSNWPDNIAKDPISVYENFKWSEVTGNTSTIEVSKQNKQEIARLVLSYGDVIDTLDDTLIILILSKLSDKKISSLIKDKVKSIVNKVVTENKQGDRKEALEKEVENLLNDEQSEYSNETDFDESDNNLVIDIDNNDVDDIETNKDVDIQATLKRRIKVIENAILNEDFDANIKELMRTNAIKYMWYLEVSK